MFFSSVGRLISNILISISDVENQTQTRYKMNDIRKEQTPMALNVWRPLYADLEYNILACSCQYAYQIDTRCHPSDLNATIIASSIYDLFCP